ALGLDVSLEPPFEPGGERGRGRGEVTGLGEFAQQFATSLHRFGLGLPGGLLASPVAVDVGGELDARDPHAVRLALEHRALGSHDSSSRSLYPRLYPRLCRKVPEWYG